MLVWPVSDDFDAGNKVAGQQRIRIGDLTWGITEIKTLSCYGPRLQRPAKGSSLAMMATLLYNLRLNMFCLKKSVAGSELPRTISVPDIRRDSSQSLFAVLQIIGFHLSISDIRKAISFEPLELVVFVANV